MVWFNFNKVTDPPNDELVNPVTQINNNLQEIDNKTKPFTTSPAVFGAIPLQQGIEAFDPDPGHSTPERIAVWTGSVWSRSINPLTGVGAWTAFGIRSPIVLRTGFTPVAKIDTWNRRVYLSGGVQLNATADPLVVGTTYEVTDNTGLSASVAPVNGAVSIQYGAVGAITSASGFGAAVVTIDLKTVPSRTAISVRYQGDAGGGNFVMFDGISWWY